MHTGFEIDGDSGGHIRRQAGKTAAVSSDRRISGLGYFSKVFPMKNFGGGLVSCSSLFLRSKSSEMYSLPRVYNRRNPRLVALVILRTFVSTGVAAQHSPVGRTFQIVSSTQIVWSVIRRITVNMINDHRDILQVNLTAQGKDYSMRGNVLTATVNDIPPAALLHRTGYFARSLRI